MHFEFRDYEFRLSQEHSAEFVNRNAATLDLLAVKCVEIPEREYSYLTKWKKDEKMEKVVSVVKYLENNESLAIPC